MSCFQAEVFKLLSSLSVCESFSASGKDLSVDVGYGIGYFDIPIIWQFIENIVLKDESHYFTSSCSISSRISSVSFLSSSRSALLHVGLANIPRVVRLRINPCKNAR